MLLLPLYPSNHNTLLQCCVPRGGLHYRRCGKKSQKGTEAGLENLGMGCDGRIQPSPEKVVDPLRPLIQG